ncbi:hypothetical protein U2F10_25825 [Leptothoe sp. EHU-05/26/07-4]
MKQASVEKFVNKLEELNIKPELVALAVNKSARAVQLWKKGTHTPRLTPKEMAAFCELLHVSIQELAEMFEETQVD